MSVAAASPGPQHAWRRLALVASALPALAACVDAAPERVAAVAAPPAVQRIEHFRLSSLTARTRAGRPVARLRCRPGTAPHAWVHVELFLRGRVALLPPGIGIAPPRRARGAYVRGGRCRYPVWTDEPTGLVAVARPGLRLGELFRVWGRTGLLRGDVRVHVDGRRVRGAPAAVPLRRHAQVVVQAGAPWVRPHARYAFPPGR